MFYTIYKITNLINGKFYIGKHQTKDLSDNYFGSGRLLKRAIEKYGKENFKKEILEIFDREEKMNLAEKILVVPDIEVSYNLCPGGHGGFGYINNFETRPWLSENGKKSKNYIQNFTVSDEVDEQRRIKRSKTLKQYYKKNGHQWSGKKRSEESKQKQSSTNKGRVPWNKGKTGFVFSEEHRKNISKSRKVYESKK
jgi:hypothetical protein